MTCLNNVYFYIVLFFLTIISACTQAQEYTRGEDTVRLLDFNRNTGTSLPEEEFISKARWIWFPEIAGINAVKQNRYFRKKMNISGEIKDGTLCIAADDGYDIYINGTHVEKHSGGRWKNVIDLKDYFKNGDNIIAVRVLNNGGAAGLICKGDILLSSGCKIGIYSNSEWKVSKELQENGWLFYEYDDTAWFSPRILGDVSSAPWCEYLDFQLFMTDNEYAVYKKSIEKQEIEFFAIVKKLEKERKPIVKVGYINNSPYISINDKHYPPVFKKETFYLTRGRFDLQTARCFKNLKAAEINIYGVDLDLKSMWLTPDQIDFKKIDNLLLKILSINSESYFILGVSLDPPDWWLKLHPDELIEYATSSIANDTDPIGRYPNASLASRVWQEETGGILKKIIQHFDELSLGKRIIAYQPNYGVYNEWHYYGMAKDMPDTGKAMTREFRIWLKNNYSNVTFIQNAWRDYKVNFDNATVPSMVERLKMGCVSLRNPSTEQKVLDYYYCHQKVVKECLLYFDKIVKKETQNRLLAGNYYGYLFGGVSYPPEGCHSEFEKVLEDPNVDYLAAPYCYGYFREMGESGQIRTVSESYRIRKKLHIMEADTRTYLADTSDNKQVSDLSGTIASLQRDFCNAFVHGSGMWWYPFNDNWYDDNEIFNCLKTAQAISVAHLENDKSSISEVVVVCDFENVIYTSYARTPIFLQNALVNGVIKELSHTGVPFDSILLSDIGHSGLPDYKVYIFLNTIFLKKETREMIDKLKGNGKTILWLYAPGAITETEISEKAASELIGMKIKYINEKTKLITQINSIVNPVTLNLQNVSFPSEGMYAVTDGPIFYVDDNTATVLGNIKYGDRLLPSLAIKQFNDYNVIYCSTPFISRAILRNIFKFAGIHSYINSDDIIYVNKSYFTIHTKNGGTKKINLTRKYSSVKELFSNKTIGSNLSSFEIEMKPSSTMLFNMIQ